MTRFRRLVAAAALAALLGSCGDGDSVRQGGRDSIVFSILAAENQATSGPRWQPLLDDMEAEIGVEVEPFFATNYNALIEAMRFDQVQVGWFSALPALREAYMQQIFRNVAGDLGIDAAWFSSSTCHCTGSAAASSSS